MRPTIADCKCHNFINKNGYGICRKKTVNFGGAYVCYVDRPSSCGDLQESITNPEYLLSAEACEGNETI